MENLAVTTTYIYSEIMNNTKFFRDIDTAIKLAKEFIIKYPDSTNWEELEHKDWETELYTFCINKLGI